MKKILLLTIASWLLATEITLYNDFAFVKEQREIQNHIISPLPNTIIPESIYIEELQGHFRFIPGGFDREKLLRSLLHKRVTFDYKKKWERGEIISIDPIIIQGKERVYFDVAFKDLHIPKLEIQTDPRLYIQEPAEGITELFYLMRGVKYKTIYNAKLAKSLDLRGFIKIEDQSGYKFKQAKISIVAGDVKREEEYYPQRRYFTKSLRLEAMAPAKPKSIQGLYKYEIPGKWDLQDKTFIPFLHLNLPYVIAYKADFDDMEYDSGITKEKFRQILLFKPTKPLPSGTMSLYKSDLFLSELYIPNSAPNMVLRLELGKDFDLEAKRIVKKYKNTKKSFFAKMHYIVTNPKKEKVTVRIFEHLPWANMRIKSKQKYHKVNAFTISFVLTLLPQSSISFDVDYSYHKK